jgi:hypothetical protein
MYVCLHRHMHILCSIYSKHIPIEANEHGKVSTHHLCGRTSICKWQWVQFTWPFICIHTALCTAQNLIKNALPPPISQMHIVQVSFWWRTTSTSVHCAESGSICSLPHPRMNTHPPPSESCSESGWHQCSSSPCPSTYDRPPIFVHCCDTALGRSVHHCTPSWQMLSMIQYIDSFLAFISLIAK